MNVLNRITLQVLKKNETRTLVTIIGIMLSATMICAVTTFVSSLMNYGQECTIYTEGNWHTKQNDTEYNTYKKIAKDDRVEQAAYLQQIGYSDSVKSENELKPYIYVLGAGEGTQDFLPIHMTSGKYPANSREIILPEHLSSDGGVTHKIGDTVTLDIGQRLLYSDSLGQNEPCYTYNEQGLVSNGEELKKTEKRTYTVVGFYERLSYSIEDHNAPGYTAITIADKPSDDYRYDVYLRLDNPKDTQAFIEQHNLSGDVNSELLMFSGVFMVESFTKMLFGLAAIIIVLIMLGSIALIYNAFSISVSERTKQFGLLSSVGATKKQIRHMVLFEALSVSAIGIPLGIIFGVAGIGVTLLFVGNAFSGMDVPIDLTLSVSPAAIIIAIIIALFTVLISAWIPSKRATKTSAVEAIRQTVDISAKGKKVRTSRLVSKLFGVPGVIADKHYKRNSKKYRTTVLSLFMSIVLFVCASAFTEYLTVTADGVSNVSNYEIGLTVETSKAHDITPEKLLDKIKSAQAVTGVAYNHSFSVCANIDKKYLSEGGAKHVDSVKASNSTSDYYLKVAFVDDDSYRNIIKENNLNENEYFNPQNPLAIALDGAYMYNSESGRTERVYLFSGDECEVAVKKNRELSGYYYYGEVTDENGNTFIRYQKDGTESADGDNVKDVAPDEAFINTNLKVGAVVDDFPFSVSNIYGTCLIYPYSLASAVFEDYTGEANSLNYNIKSDNHTKSAEQIKMILADCGITQPDLVDYAQAEESRRNIVTVVRVFSYGFVILISLIAAANVFNTISTNISLRRKEFAVLKSIGMTRKDFNKMMNFECLLYGSRALLYGLPVSILITYLIYLSVMNGADVAFTLPWNAIGIVVLSVFVVVFVTMIYSMRKIKKDNPIEALKNENI